MTSNNELVNHLINTGVLHSSNIIDAFVNIDRIDFVGNPTVPDVYADYPLQIGSGQTISQPTTVAMMLEMLNPKNGNTILDIGSGSGWTTALLSFIVGSEGSVIGMERVDSLVEFGSGNLKKYGFKNSKIIKASDELGVVGEKFDRILVSAAAEEFPDELINQLETDGKLVIPVRSSIYEIKLKKNGELDATEHYGFTFVPLVV